MTSALTRKISTTVALISFVQQIDDTFLQTQLMTAADGRTGDRFGQTISTDRDLNDRTVVLVGAPRHDVEVSPGTSLTDSGAAYVFSFNATSIWEQKIVSQIPATDGRFGGSVSVKHVNSQTLPGNDAAGMAIGAPKEPNGLVLRAGSATFYSDSGNLTNTNWGQVARFYGDHFNAQFGKSVGVEHDSTFGLLNHNLFMVFVGSRLDDEFAEPNTKRSGACSLFSEKSINGWERILKFAGHDTDQEDRFGHSLTVNGDFVIVGAPTREENGIEGSAYLFKVLGFDEDCDN